MIDDSYNLTLLIAVVWPLLLALPALHSRLPWPQYLAIIPAIALIVLPGTVTLPLPGLFFGTALAVDREVRWILVMWITIWIILAQVANPAREDRKYYHQTPYFFLTLASSLGAIVETELNGFLIFSSIMSYSLYGLLPPAVDNKTKSGGRPYIICLVLADLVLFEAMLLAAFSSRNLDFEVVRQIMGEASSSQFYLLFVLIGFTLKAGVWPVYQWLLGAFKSEQQPVVLLLGGIPIAISLLGLLRFLPFGGHSFYISGMVILGMGVVAMFYALFKTFSHTSLKTLAARVVVAAMGLCAVVLGLILIYPVVWQRHEHQMYRYLATLGISLAALTFILNRCNVKGQKLTSTLPRIENFILWLEKGFNLIGKWTKERFPVLQSNLRNLILKVEEKNKDLFAWEKTITFNRGWNTSVTIFALLGLAFALLAR